MRSAGPIASLTSVSLAISSIAIGHLVTPIPSVPQYLKNVTADVPMLGTLKKFNRRRITYKGRKVGAQRPTTFPHRPHPLHPVVLPHRTLNENLLESSNPEHRSDRTMADPTQERSTLTQVPNLGPPSSPAPTVALRLVGTTGLPGDMVFLRHESQWSHC